MSIDIGDKVKILARVDPVLQRIDHYLWAKMRAANADIDDIGDGLVISDLIGKCEHLIQSLMHLLQREAYLGRPRLHRRRRGQQARVCWCT